MGFPFVAGLAGRSLMIVLALAAIIAVPAAVVQTVRLDGISIFGWQVVDGFKPEADRLRSENATLSQNAGAYRDGLQSCNAGIERLRSASDDATKSAEAALNAARENGRELESKAVAILAKRNSDSDACAAADRLILGSLK
jgi:hypothetical protein